MSRIAEVEIRRARRRFAHRMPRTVWVAIGLTVMGCAAFALDGDLVVSSRVADDGATPGDPALIEVTAQNTGDSRIQWGNGSSSCQLSLVVRVDGEDWRAIDRRGCTLDYAPQALGAGESRTETIPWGGEVLRKGSQGPVMRLEPGVYEVRGAAGDVASSAPVAVRVEAES